MAKQGAKAAVPRLRFLEFGNEPQWETSHLGDICELYQPETIPSSSFTTDGMHLVYGAGGVIGRLDRFNHEHAEVIIGCRGVCGNASLTEPKSWITGNAMVIRSKSDKLSKPFLFHLLDAADLSPVISGSAQPQITRQGLRRFSISAPAPAEQQKIADCLTSLDEVIAAQGRKVEALKAHRRGLMQQLFPRAGETRPRLRFPEFRNAPEWEVARVRDLFDTSSGGTPDRKTKKYWGGGVPWVTTSMVNFNVITNADEFISEAGLKSSSAKVFPKGTVVVAMYGQGKTRGQVALLGVDAATNQACAAILPSDDIEPEFVFFSLSGRYDELRSLSNSGGQENLSQGLIRELPFRYPKDKNEQAAIIDCLASVDTYITAETARLAALKTHKQGLMQQLFPVPEAAQA